MGVEAASTSNRQTGPSSDSPVVKLKTRTDQKIGAPYGRRADGSAPESVMKCNVGVVRAATTEESGPTKTSYAMAPALASVPAHCSETSGDSSIARSAGNGARG